MPYRLHPSGYCTYYDDSSQQNLIPGKPCIFCGRVAGHAHGCPEFDNFPLSGMKDDMLNGKSSRGALFNATSVLWARSRVKSFITFTLPSHKWTDGYYQQSPSCDWSGDIAVTRQFSKVMEAYALKHKRATGEKISYVWVSEAQMKRQEKFGGCGDIHFHLVVNQKYKEDLPYDTTGGRSRYRFIDQDAEDEIYWLQSLWCKHIGLSSQNCVHVDPIPDDVDSIPAYLSKYLGKGSMRRILSRRFSATRDLTKLKPITLMHKPDIGLINQQVKEFKYMASEFCVESGKMVWKEKSYQVVSEYYSTSETLSHYGNLMEDESRFVGGAKGRARDLNDEQAKLRAERKTEREFWEKACMALQRPEPLSTEIRPTDIKKPLSYRTKKELKLERELSRLNALRTKG